MKYITPLFLLIFRVQLYGLRFHLLKYLTLTNFQPYLDPNPTYIECKMIEEPSIEPESHISKNDDMFPAMNLPGRRYSEAWTLNQSNIAYAVLNVWLGATPLYHFRFPVLLPMYKHCKAFQE